MKKKNIFLIEDNIATIDVYKTGLTGAGFDVDVAVSGQEAIEKIQEANKNLRQKFDLVLIDIVLPDISGMDILREIRKMENIKDVKTIILTNYTSKDFEKESLKLKALRYVLKSENPPSELVKIIKKELN